MKVKDNFVVKHILDNDVVIDITGKSKNLLKLNETASFMFDNLVNGITYEELLDKMIKEYDAPKDVLEKDVNNFIDKLKELNVLDD